MTNNTATKLRVGINVGYIGIIGIIAAVNLVQFNFGYITKSGLLFLKAKKI